MRPGGSRVKLPGVGVGVGVGVGEERGGGSDERT
jgi:hypothetical protein